MARYHSLTFDAKTRQLKNEPDEEKREVAASLDGSYLLRTDRQDLSAEEAWRIYASLTRAENAFRCMKSPLSERPIFHHLEHRVESHIFLCVLAYHLLVAIETTLQSPRDSHVMGDGSRPAGNSPDRDDRSADRPERSSADSS